MRKTKILITIFMIIAILFSFSANVIATEPGDNARQGINPDETSQNEQNNEQQNEANHDEPVKTAEGEPVTTDDEEQNNQEIPSNEIHEGDLYIGSDEKLYEMDKFVDGNIYIFGNKVKVTGAVNGSAFIFAQEVIIEEEAYIGAQLFIAGEKVTINGGVADVYAAANKFTMGETAEIYRDLKVVAQNINLAGHIDRTADLMAREIEIAETEEGLNVHGDFNYTAEKEIENLEEKATILGETQFTKYVEDKRNGTNTVSQLVWSAIGTVAFDVVMYLILLFMAPNFIKKAKGYVSTKGLLGLAIGLGFAVLVPFIALLLLMTGIGAGLSVMLLFVYGTVLMINAFITTTITNEFIANKLNFADDKLKKTGLIAIVSLAIWGLRELPFIGGWISVVVFLFGIGIVVLYQFDRVLKKEN